MDFNLLIFPAILQQRMENVTLQPLVAEVWQRNIIGITKTEYWKLQLIQQSMIAISSHSKDRIKVVNKSNCPFLTIYSLS